MNWHSELRRIDKREDELILDFAGHAVFGRLQSLPADRFIAILVQRRFVSLGFAPLYELALDGLTDASSRDCARDILREEYGPGNQTHREDLVHDLLAIGATRDQILTAVPTSITMNILQSLFFLLRKEEEEKVFQSKLLTVIRMAGEILVSVEYQQFWPRLQAMGLSAARAAGRTTSLFYYPHMAHDAMKHRLGDEPDDPCGRVTHADRRTACLRRSSVSGPANGIEHCLAFAEAVQRSKRGFYDQFIG